MRKKRMLRLTTMIVAVVLTAGILPGCTNQQDRNVSQEVKEDLTNGYPLKTDKKLSYWIINNPPIGKYSDRSQYPFADAWEERTGVEIEYMFPPIGQEDQQLSVLLSSGDLPDLIEYRWCTFPGGPDKLIEDGYALRLNELIDQYAPNLKKYLAEHPEVDKMVKTDAGNYFCFPALAQSGEDAEKLLVTNGYMMRKDWLDDLGLEIPTTIDEWHEVLKAFKEKKGAEAPLSLMSYQLNTFAGAFGGKLDFYQEGGKVKYGKTGESYRKFLTTMNQWYNEGLLDKNFANLDRKMIDSKVLGGKTGATHGWIGSWMGTWLNVAKEKNMEFDLVGVPFPTLEKGAVPEFGTKTQLMLDLGVIITGSCKNPELAVKMLDYGYGEEGHMFFNFGTEGLSYNMVDGYPQYTELITQNPDKLSISDAMALYCKGNAGGAFVQDKRYIEQFYPLPQQKEAQETWMKAGADKDLPMITMTGDESSEYNNIMSDVDTYSNEMMLKFIIGAEPMSSYDQYMQQMEQLGLNRAIELKQAAFDRYQKR